MKTSLLSLCGIALLACSPQIAQAETLDDFESYAPQVGFTTPSSTPWSRFGNAVADGLTVVVGEGADKSKGATIALNITGQDNGTIRFAPPKPLDLREKGTISLDIRQAKELPGLTVLCQIESPSGTIWQVSAQPLTSHEYTTYSFVFAAGDAIKTQGNQSLDEVLASVAAIRFRFASETEGVSSLRFDNLKIGE
jgi:hypothetical protein